jgi:hypothetical protein
MITSYSDLKASIAEYAHRTDLTAPIINFIADAEARIYNDLRLRSMETAFSEAIASGSVAVPSGLLAWKYLYVDGSTAQKLTRKDAEWIYTNYPSRSAGGKPVYFAREAETLIFGPYPDSAYTIKGIYYKRLAALSDSNTSNWFITDAPDLLRYAALAEAAAWTRDERDVTLFEGKYQTIKTRLERTERNEAFSGSQLSVTQG